VAAIAVTASDSRVAAETTTARLGAFCRRVNICLTLGLIRNDPVKEVNQEHYQRGQ
jgi:hypothetical protein